MRNPNRNVFVGDYVGNPPLPKSRVWPSLVPIDKEVNGHIERSIGYEMVDRCVPVTPQTGLDVHIGDLSFMAQNNLFIEHQPAYISLLGRNPFTQAEFTERLTNNYDSLLTHLKKGEEKSED